MLHLTVARASLGKRLLTTTSALAIAAGISAGAQAANVILTNVTTTVPAGVTVAEIVLNDGQTHTGSVVNNGTVSNTANLVGTLALATAFQDKVGTFAQSGGVIAFAATPTPAQHGSITATTLTAAAGSTFQAIEQPVGAVFATNTTYADVLVSGAPIQNNFTVTSSNPAFTPTLVQDASNANALDLDLNFVGFTKLNGAPANGTTTTNGTTTGPLIDLTRNGLAAANAFDSLFKSGNPNATPVLASFLAITPAQEAAALNGPLNGSQIPQTGFAVVTTVHSDFNLIMDRLAPGGGNFGVGVSTASLAGDPSNIQIAGLDVYSDADGEELAQAGGSGGARSPWAFWSRGYGNFASGGSTAAAPGFSANTGGVLFGADYKLDLNGAGNALVGAAFNYSNTSVEFNDGAGSSQIADYSISPYGRYALGDWYASGVGTFGVDTFDIKRNISFPGFAETAKSSPNGQVIGVAGETGYALHPDLAKPLTVTPLVGFAYTHLHTDGSVESGAGAADLDFNGTNADSLTSSLGARASARIDTDAYGTFVPEAHAIWQHEYLDDRAKVGVAFTESPGGRFTIVSSRFGADTGLLGVGVSHDAGSNVTVFVNYDAQLQSNFTSHTISAGLRVKF
jgi:uncharacterized protein with beta-barrel porin domain